MSAYQCSICKIQCDISDYHQCSECSQWQTPDRCSASSAINAQEQHSEKEPVNDNPQPHNQREPQSSESISKCTTPDLDSNGICGACGLPHDENQVNVQLIEDTQQNFNQSKNSINNKIKYTNYVSNKSEEEDSLQIQLSLHGHMTPPISHGVFLGRDSLGDKSVFVNILEKYMSVSRFHAWIGVSNYSVIILDLNSVNKTSVETNDGTMERLNSGKLYIFQSSQLPINVSLGKDINLIVEKVNG